METFATLIFSSILSPLRLMRVHLIDFDWEGRIGEARYPHGLNYKVHQSKG